LTADATRRIATTVEKVGAAAPAAALRATAAEVGVKFEENLASHAPSADFVEKVPIAFARRHQLIGLAADEGPLPVVMADLASRGALQVVARFLGRRVEPRLAPAAHVSAAINAAYQERTGQAKTFIEKLDPGEALIEFEKLGRREDLLDLADRAPVVKLVNLVLFEAVQARASDIHFQPTETELLVRLRIDGVLHDAFRLPARLLDETVSRIKIMGRMNIAEKRLPQDGRATVQVGDRAIDLRVATLPGNFGERVVIRLLDKSARLFNLREIGMEPTAMERFRRLISADHGLILVTGPTGSGKTTTLYSALQEINSRERNILTLEDPIEYQLDGVSQTQVSEKKGMTFASGLRSVLRQDPDIIMIGEIRDRETAVMAIQSALTGHLVFSTLHTNDAAGAVARLLDLGIESYLLASSLIGVVAQRLIRRLCPQCARPASADDLQRLMLSDDRSIALEGAKAAAGCAACRNTGYRGRVGIFEMLAVDESVRKKIQASAAAADVAAAARAGGMRTLREDGLAKLGAGQTSVEEVLRATMRASASPFDEDDGLTKGGG
jgi:general secretion pathway protein E